MKDHNLEFPNVDLPTSDVSSHACTTMPQLDTSTPDAETGTSASSSASHLLLSSSNEAPACTMMPQLDTSIPAAETEASPSSCASHLPSSAA